MIACGFSGEIRALNAPYDLIFYFGLTLCPLRYAMFFTSPPRGELLFQPPAIIGHGETTQEIEDGNENIGLPAEPHPLGLGEYSLRRLENIEERNDDHQGRIFECRDENTHRGRNDDLQGLRQNDQPHGEVVVQSQGVRRLILSAGHPL